MHDPNGSFVPISLPAVDPDVNGRHAVLGAQANDEKLSAMTEEMPDYFTRFEPLPQLPNLEPPRAAPCSQLSQNLNTSSIVVW